MKTLLCCILFVVLFSLPAFAGVPVTGVTLSEQNVALSLVGMSNNPQICLIATITPENASNKNISWKSSNEAVATISRVSGTSNGIVEGINSGTAVITVTTEDGDFISTCTVVVTEPDLQRTNQNYSSNIREVAAKMAGFNEDDFEIVDGKVVIKKSIAETIAKNLLEKDDIEVILLPWAEATFQRSGKNGKTAIIFKFVNESLLNEEMMLLNIDSSVSGEFLGFIPEEVYFSEEADYYEGKYTFSIMQNTNQNIIDNPGALIVFIKDGGRFDLDKTENGSVINQFAIVRKAKHQTDPIDPVKGNNGSGCNIVYMAISRYYWLVLGVVLSINRKNPIRMK